MHASFTIRLNPTQLAIAPYVPVVQRELRTNPEEIGLKINKQGLYVLPNIAGFVGADTVGHLATGLNVFQNLPG